MESRRSKGALWTAIGFFLFWYLVVPIFIAGGSPAQQLLGLILLLVFVLVWWRWPAKTAPALGAYIGASLGLGFLTGYLMLWFIEAGYGMSMIWVALLIAAGFGAAIGIGIVMLARRAMGTRPPKIEKDLLVQMDDEK